MDDVVISVQHVSKKYSKSLRKSMLYGIADIGRNSLGLRSHSERLRSYEFWALDDVSFEVKRGETIGVIGPNGSGKTTLLKLINGIFWPDKGKITVKGRVGALIAVGAGFHPLLTGRENIYVNGAILGMSKREVDQKFDSIVEFADIGDFLDAPVKHYSSGMFVRLGFAVAVHCEPEILLVDEVLAVGDMEFALKCYQIMHQVVKRGTTILLVSHSTSTIREMATKGLYIDHGKTKFLGSSDDATDIYTNDILEYRAAQLQTSATAQRGNLEKARLSSVKFFDKYWKEVSCIECGDELNIAIECDINEQLRMPIFGVNFYDNRGFSYCANSQYERVSLENLSPGRFRIKINFPHLYLPFNSYLCSAIVAEESTLNLLDWHDKRYKFIVKRAKDSRGYLKLPHSWEAEKISTRETEDQGGDFHGS